MEICQFTTVYFGWFTCGYLDCGSPGFVQAQGRCNSTCNITFLVDTALLGDFEWHRTVGLLNEWVSRIVIRRFRKYARCR
jgi:hypothetical protein